MYVKLANLISFYIIHVIRVQGRFACGIGLHKLPYMTDSNVSIYLHYKSNKFPTSLYSWFFSCEQAF